MSLNNTTRYDHTASVPNHYGSDYFVLYRCSDCGAAIHEDDSNTHDEFHTKIDELIEWAQAVSKAIGGNNGQPENG